MLINKKWLSLFACFLLSGCWDQRFLKDVKLVQGISIDYSIEHKYELSVALQKTEKVTSMKSLPVLTENGYTLREAKLKINKRVSGDVDTSGNKVILINENVARYDVYSPLDVIFRDSHNSFTTKLAITDVSARSVLNTQIADEPFIGNHIYKLIRTGESKANIPKTNIQQFFTNEFGSATDGVLPVLTTEKKEGTSVISLSGAALFNDLKMSGKLDTIHSQVLQLLSGNKGKDFSMTVQVFEGDKNDPKNYVTFMIRRIIRQLEANKTSETTWYGNVILDIIAEIVEKPNTKIIVKENAELFNQSLSAKLTKYALETIEELQQAHCDALGFGMKIRKQNPNQWDREQWKEMYHEGDIGATIHLRVTSEGLLE
ncbi:Ger(x)C family spore germination protein [Paenibacillus sp. P36]|uniref:Ger(x)C family spore germination protein n=1 Tax=Paenibacillus sp. P36 TaxID=3342538 RepID=UPI0038B37996